MQRGKKDSAKNITHPGHKSSNAVVPNLFSPEGRTGHDKISRARRRRFCHNCDVNEMMCLVKMSQLNMA